ncbi:acyltransferase family protein [Bradyrhizobium iriomotense]|uniref:acyltransferase family protein n=1 Tax=Bradyrhizobium iriomotense TaxID=441950 RepID=UPI0024E12438|nr:acyltransferase [Bradyrhizobium iriomotense]
MSKRQFPNIDILRFFAACLVMFYHLAVSSWAAAGVQSANILGGRASFPELLPYFWSGFVGVEIFFVISGFVISFSAERSEAFSFARSRVFRLYPAAWICSTISLVALIYANIAPPESYLKPYFHSLLLSPKYPWIDSVYWTLGIEISFYALIFLVLAVGFWEFKTTIAYVLGSVSAAYWICGYLVMPQFLASHLWSRPLELSLVPYGCYFALGMMLFFHAARGLTSREKIFCGVLAIGATIEIMFKAEHANRVFHSAQSNWVPVAIFVIFVALAASALTWQPERKLATCLRQLGLATYPLYLLHDNAGTVLMSWLLDNLTGYRFLALAVTMVACIATALLIALVLEPPIRGFLAALWRPRKSRGAVIQDG